MGTPLSVSGASPPGSSRRGHEVHLAAFPNWPVSAIHTVVRSFTAWASDIGAAFGASVMVCVSSAYPVEHTAAVHTTYSSMVDSCHGNSGHY